MLKRPRVYIAGPITKGDQFVNLRNAKIVWHDLWQKGFAPFCPHWSCYQHAFEPLPYEDWMTYDFAWIAVCDALFRMIGESPGADREVVFANDRGIPVFHNADTMRLHFYKS